MTSTTKPRTLHCLTRRLLDRHVNLPSGGWDEPDFAFGVVPDVRHWPRARMDPPSSEATR